MTTKHQRYSPDTCSCVVLETWDTEVPADARVHTYEALEHLCEPHAALGLDGLTAYQALLADNHCKNLVLVIAKSVRGQVVDTDYTWSFDSQRVIQVRIAGLTAPQRLTLQQALDLQFGPGKAVVL